ncbi:vWA domain-containing protein [Phosphitispora fastidiosa]|uniref:vWA domain-containing protein n=1 Tax=Phosphitispora fastidiosa TaxID=2837202 RepID=UPI001E49348D|nr:VWA domain-containing protein [Phosphitispora fastidiosa]MBU7005296.1 magnesium chelatase subunit D [Phosphitispora fastidiosa]
MSANQRASYNYQKLKIVSQNLGGYFDMNQGVIMGTTAVVSQLAHHESAKSLGEVGISRDRDAGQHYFNLEEPRKVVHIDVLHNSAEINQVDVANRIRQIIPNYLNTVDRNQDLSPEEQDLAAANISRGIHLQTALGYGTSMDPDQKAVKGTDDRYLNHIHLLAKLKPRYYSLAYCLIDEIERAIIYQGAQLRKVIKIIHYGSADEGAASAASTLYLPPVSKGLSEALRHQNMLQVMNSLAMRLGSIEAVVDFFKYLSPIRNFKLGSFQKDKKEFDKLVSQLVKNDIVKQTLFGYTLTDTGNEMQDFLKKNKKELAAQIRKCIRQFRHTQPKFQSFRYSHLKSKEKQFPNRRKVVTPNDPVSWKGEIAVPETVVEAARRSFLSKSSSINITVKDIKVYARKSYAPVDTCLLVDCSGSMMGDRIRAVSNVAEYLLLNSREKVSMVTFQERQAKVLVPFTRSYSELHQGLSKIIPGGLTPLALGLKTTVDMFKKERPRNPLLVLITDGIPNYPLWTTDPIEDAIKAAAMIAEENIHFICIGIDPNHEFLPLLAEAGKGNSYIVDDNDRNNLIGIVSQVKKEFQSGHKQFSFT